MGWAIQAIEDDEMLAERKEQLDLLTKVLTASKVQRFEIVQQLGTDGEKIRSLLELWLLWWRDIVLAANDCLDLTVNVDRRDLLKAQAAKIGSSEAQRMIRTLLQVQETLDQNVNARLALEVLMLDMPTLKVS
jgi:DNA polymerase-3 subunit delta'